MPTEHLRLEYHIHLDQLRAIKDHRMTSILILQSKQGRNFRRKAQIRLYWSQPLKPHKIYGDEPIHFIIEPGGLHLPVTQVLNNFGCRAYSSRNGTVSCRNLPTNCPCLERSFQDRILSTSCSSKTPGPSHVDDVGARQGHSLTGSWMDNPPVRISIIVGTTKWPRAPKC